jgi:hypothetical protein
MRLRTALVIGMAIASPALADFGVMPMIDLGSSSPLKESAPRVLRIPGSNGLQVEALLTLRMETTDGATPPEESELLVRAGGGEWSALLPSIPLALVLNAGGELEESHPIHIQASPRWTSAPGERRGTLAIVANGVPLGETAISWMVEPLVLLRSDRHPFRSPDIDATRPGDWAYEPHRYTVKANVEWRLELDLRAPLMKEGAAKPLEGDPLVVRAADGTWHSLASAQPVVVASGGPTGDQEASVEIALSARTRGDEAGGVYGGALEIRVVAASQP